MKTHSKLKNPPRPLFSCGIFGHCSQTVVSPTTPQSPALLLPPPPPESDPPAPASDPPPPSSSSSSSSSTSQSFTQWRFPLSKPPFSHNPPPESVSVSESDPPQQSTSEPNPPLPPLSSSSMAELFHVAELELISGSDSAQLSSLQLLEKTLVPNPLPDGGGAAAACPATVMKGVVGKLKDAAVARTATKVLLALCLGEENRRVAVEAGAVAEVVETVTELEGAAAERALAVLELLCTVAEGAAELRTHALTVPVLVEMVGKMGGRGKECAISVLAAVFCGGEMGPPPPLVAQAVVLALQGDCSARGRRKGTQLLKAIEENGRLNLTEESC